MRILHVIDHLGRGGGSVSALQFASAAHARGVEQHDFLTIDNYRRDEIQVPLEITVFENHRRSLTACAKWVAGAGYDVVHWHWWHHMPLMEKLAGYGGHRRVITVDVFPAGSVFRLSKFEIDYADMVVFDGKDALEAYPEIPIDKKCWILGGTNLDLYKTGRSRPANGRLRIGRGSALARRKCPPNLIEMVAPVLRTIPDADFHIFGEGPLQRRLRRDVRRIGLADRIIFRGYVANFEEEIANLDLYLYHLPLHSFASSELNLQGAAAASLPIVIVPSAGTRWMFRHGIDAMVASNAEEAASYAVELLRDPARAAAIGRAACDKATKEWGMRVMVDGYRQRVYAAIKPPPSPLSRAVPSRAASTVRRWRSLAGRALMRLAERMP